MKAFRKRVSVRMVRLDDGSETTQADLLGTIEGAKNRSEKNPLQIYNAGVAKMLVEKGIVIAIECGYVSGDEAARAALEAEVRNLHYRVKTWKYMKNLMRGHKKP